MWSQARSLLKRPGTSALAVVALALGIGLTTTMFGIIDGVLLRGLPFERPDRIVAIGAYSPDQRHPANIEVLYRSSMPDPVAALVKGTLDLLAHVARPDWRRASRSAVSSPPSMRRGGRNAPPRSYSTRRRPTSIFSGRSSASGLVAGGIGARAVARPRGRETDLAVAACALKQSAALSR